MKKIFVLLFCLILGGCTPVVRNNPTDPKSSNYGGWTYLGEIGNFTQLSDFTIVYGAPSGQDYFYCLDSGNKSLSEYFWDGTNENVTITNSPLPAPQIFDQPSGICNLQNWIYNVDNAAPTINAFPFPTMAGYSNIIAASGSRITSCTTAPHVGLYVAVSSTPAVYEYSSDTVLKTYTLQNTWIPLTITAISDIEVHGTLTTATDIMIADPVKKIIACYTLSGVFEKTINIGTDIIGIASYQDDIYVPTYNGILKIDFTSGNVISTIANYGDGNGRIIKPAVIRLYTRYDGTNYILVNNDTSIKYFQINSL